MKKLVLILVGLFYSNFISAQGLSVPVWGVYWNIHEPEAAPYVADLSKVGYKLERLIGEYGKDYLFLIAGDVEELSKVLRRRRRDRIRVTYIENPRCFDREDRVVKDSVIKYKFIRKELIYSYENQLPNIFKQRHLLTDFETKQALIEREVALFKKMLRQKGHPKFVEDAGFLLLEVPETDKEVVFRFIRKKKEIATLRFDTLRGKIADKFYALKDDECIPCDRAVDFRNYYAEKAVQYPKTYVPRSTLLVKKNYQITFGKNKIKTSSESVKPIISLMTDNNFSIVSAKVEGLASVEGSIEINQRLQERRAKVLIDLLEKYNDEKITLDTVITRENWPAFYKSIEGGTWDWMRNLSREEIKDTLSNKDFVEQIEYLLAPQRIATLQILAGQKLSLEEKIERSLTDLKAASMLYCRNDVKISKKDLTPRVMAVLEYMEQQVEMGNLSAEVLRNAFGSQPHEIDILFLKAYSDYFLHGKISKVFDVENVLEQAFDLHTKNFQNYSRNLRDSEGCLQSGEYSFNRLYSIQYMLEKLAVNNFITPSSFMEISYPGESSFYGLSMNLVQAKQDFVLALPVAEREKFKTREHEQMSGLMRINSPLYLMVRKIALENNQQLIRDVYRSQRKLYWHDFYEFVKVNVTEWDYFYRKVYDDSVDYKTMRKQVNRLKGAGKYLCPWLVEQVALDFHLKSLKMYLRNGFDKLEDHGYINEDLRYLTSYYQSRAARYTGAELYKVTKMLALANQLYMSKDGTRSAYKILRAAKPYKDFSEEMTLWYYQLSYYHNPKFSNIVGNEEVPLCELFESGEGLYPFNEEMKTLYCEKCLN